MAGNGQAHHHHVFGNRAAEHAPRVGDEQAAAAHSGRRHVVDARRERVDPRQPRRAADDVVEDRCGDASAQQDPCGAHGRLGVVVDQALPRDLHHPDARDRLEPRHLLRLQRHSEDRRRQNDDLFGTQVSGLRCGGKVDSRHPPIRISDLREIRQPVRTFPDPVQEVASTRHEDRVDEALARGVLLELQVEARRHDRRQEAGRRASGRARSGAGSPAPAGRAARCAARSAHAGARSRAGSARRPRA